MALELSKTNEIYEDISVVFKHFINIAWAMHHNGKDLSLGRSRQFYYDVVSDGHRTSKSAFTSGGYSNVCCRNYACRFIQRAKGISETNNEIIRTDQI
jgi:hypothetical protein